MIAVADLLKNSRLPGNYYAPDLYIQADLESGLIENSHGARLIALPQSLLEAIYAGTEQETGQAAGLVLFNCGRWWGKNFYRRFREEVSTYYDNPLAQMEMVEFLNCLKQCWLTHGWGKINFELNYHQQGFLVVSIQNSPFAQAAPSGNQPMCFIESGILSSFFSQITGQNLHCIQTACETLGAETNYFLLGLSERLQPAEAWLEEGQDHATIMERLCPNQPEETEAV